jgi:hypothetical protein
MRRDVYELSIVIFESVAPVVVGVVVRESQPGSGPVNYNYGRIARPLASLRLVKGSEGTHQIAISINIH